MTVGIHVPGFSSTGLASGEEYRAYFRDAEALGLDALWVEDRILLPLHLADSLVLLSWAAACTERMTLGTAVLVLNLRQAPVVARQVSTLDHLSGGRVALGVSLGGRPEEYRALGVPLDQRVGVFRESLSVLRELLSGQPVTRSGRFVLDSAVVRPAARVPILIGGVADAAIRRAGALGDGWIMAPFGSLDQFRRGWAMVGEAASAAGRDPGSLTAGRLLYVAVDDDRSRARAELTRFLHPYYGPGFDVDQHAIFGPADAVAERLREQVDAGIRHLMLGVPSLNRSYLTQIGEVVAPALRD